MDKNEQKLKRLLSLMDEDSLTKEDFMESFQKVIEFVNQIDTRSQKELEQMKELFGTIAQKIESNTNSSLDGLKQQVDELFVGERIQEFRDEINELIERAEERIANVRDGRKGDKGEKGEQGEPGQDGSPDTPEEIRDKLETLEDDDRLDASAIKGLKDFMKQNIVLAGGGASAQGGGIVKVYDLSDQLDGVTKTFTLPAFWRVLNVDLSSFPNALRPTVDFTTDASAMTITFTSEIEAASSLATGQTCIVTYAE